MLTTFLFAWAQSFDRASQLFYSYCSQETLENIMLQHILGKKFTPYFWGPLLKAKMNKYM